MKQLATPLVDGLRIAVVSDDERRRQQLEEALVAFGHMVVPIEDAQAFVCDNVAVQSTLPGVLLGQPAEGFSGHLSRDATSSQIDAAVRAVAVGLIVSDSREQADGFGELAEVPTSELLTPRELEILLAISDGLSNKAIARKLAISLHTVKFHVESFFRKLGVRSRAEAVARGLERRKAGTVEV